MKIEDMKYSCKSIAKVSSAGVRLYQGNKRLYYYSIFALEPDPAAPYLSMILSNTHKAGIVTTPMFQFYGYIRMEGDFCVILGPTAVPAEDPKGLEELMFLLGVPNEEKIAYGRKLYCAPSISLERMSWMVSSLATQMNQQALYVEDVHIDSRGENHQHLVARTNALETLHKAEDEEIKEDVKDSFRYEKAILYYIQHGEVEQLIEVISATPKIRAGEMAKDTLRQVKNMGICCATISSRAAILGGLDGQSAFRLSDKYIQKIEMLRDHASVSRLINDMMIDFAKRVQEVKYGCDNCAVLFQKCASYVSENVFHVIRVENMAKEFHISRSYLSNQFRQLTGITLSQYIQKAKITEAQRMLQFTDKPLAEIASHLNYSSQSYFQNVFKKFTGETPMEFIKKNRQNQF